MDDFSLNLRKKLFFFSLLLFEKLKFLQACETHKQFQTTISRKVGKGCYIRIFGPIGHCIGCQNNAA